MTSQDRSIQYAYALDDRGVLTHIRDARRTNAYKCPGCGAALSAVLGAVKAHHFRHFDDCCGLETYLHRSAKHAFCQRYGDALRDRTPIRLGLARRVECHDPRLALLGDHGRICETDVAANYDLTQIFDRTDLEKRDNITGLRPDVLLSETDSARQCYVEVCVTHSCTEDKINTGVPILEFTIGSVDDIHYLMNGSYSLSDSNLRVYNWHPKTHRLDACAGACPLGDEELSVWSLSKTGRLNERVIPLRNVTDSNSALNTWPRATIPRAVAANLRTFLTHADPNSVFPNCLNCKHAGQWDDGYLRCEQKSKTVPYTDAAQCIRYETLDY